MSLRAIAFAAAFCLSSTLAQAAGFAFLEVAADAEGPALRGAVWYPCDAQAASAAPLALGPLITLQVAKDCAIRSGKWPMVVMSHGAGGSFLGHRDTAAALADAGFVVAAISHSGDNFEDMSRHRDLSVFISRPMDKKRLVDHMLRRWPERIAPAQIGFFGFSRGGYTGLVLAGAVPDFNQLRAHCQDPAGAVCARVSQNALPTLPPSQERRIKAFVIADPLSSVFATAGSVKDVTAPIQLWGSERGGDGVSPENVATIARNLPVKADLHLVANSGHFAFLTVCPPELVKAAPEICTDSAGFDRAAFHQQLDAQVLAFFRKKLTASAQP